VGRRDAQIKIRGFRVEPAEIERALQANDRISEAAVLVRSVDAEEDARTLVAYVAPVRWPPESAVALVQELLADLMRQVPGYMIPRIELLPSLPRTRSGKVDRTALGQLDLTVPHTTPGPDPAESPLEVRIAAIYRACLHLDEVPRTACFADLGGDSLSAMKIVSRLQDQCQVALKVRDIFDAPGIAALAEHIAELHRAALAAEPPEPITPALPDQPLVLSLAQERLWFLNQFDPGSTSYHVPAAFRIQGRVDVASLHHALMHICQRHAVLRTRIVDHGTHAAPIVPDVFTLPFVQVDLRTLDRNARAVAARQLAEREAARPFDLTHDPLIRAMVLQIDDAEAMLVIVMHHIVTDEWCADVLIREFRMFYEAAAQGLPPGLPALPIQYADFARWQKSVLAGPRLQALQEFWRRELEGAPPVLPLPLDIPRDQAGSNRGRRHGFEIDARVAHQLRSIAEAQQASLFMALLSLYQIWLAGLCEVEDIVVGSPISGRTRPETESLVGFFANLLVLRARVRSEASFRTHLRDVRERALACYEHQALSFAQLVAVLNPERVSEHAPIVQVIFGLWPRAMGDVQVGGLRLRQEPLFNQQAKYDLEMQIADTGGVLHGFLEYNAALFFPETIAEMVATYQRLCAAVADLPGATIATLRQLAGESQVMKTS
jgi:acyl carrier protein